MYLPSPEKVTQKLMGRANVLVENWPPSDWEVGRLRSDSKVLQKASASDYEMMLGICATLLGDKNKLDKHFSSAMKKTPGLPYPVSNYALSLRFLNYDDEACDLMRSNYKHIEGNPKLIGLFISTLMSAGRFHEAVVQYKKLKKLGVSANDVVEEFKRVLDIRECVVDLADEDIAAIVSYFSKFLRDSGALKINVVHEMLDADDTDQNRPGIDFQFQVRENCETAANLDFDGSMYLAGGDFELQQHGIVVMSITSNPNSVDADQAA